jgi:metal-responsive CopG/Arc/MetJ family transcriptional regulator
MRINARLDQQTRERLEYIIEHTGVNRSTAIKQAIHYSCDALSENEHPAAIMEKFGFISCANGEEDLSTTYKEVMTKSLGAKHDHR